MKPSCRDFAMEGLAEKRGCVPAAVRYSFGVCTLLVFEGQSCTSSLFAPLL